MRSTNKDHIPERTRPGLTTRRRPRTTWLDNFRKWTGSRRQNYIDCRMTARCGGKLLTVHLRRRPYDRCGQGKGDAGLDIIIGAE